MNMYSSRGTLEIRIFVIIGLLKQNVGGWIGRKPVGLLK